MSVSESQKRASKKWQAANYEDIRTRVKKGERERIKAFAESRGMSLNGFIKGLIYSAMGEAPEKDEPSGEL